VTTQPVTRVGRGVADIGLVAGRAAQKATLVGGLGSNRLTFQDLPTPSVNDADGVALCNKIRLPKGVFLWDALGCRFSLAVPPVATGGVLVDITKPVVRSVSGPVSGTYRPGQELLFTAVLSERVTATGTPTIALSFSAARRQATYASGSSTLTFRHVVQLGDVAAKGITIAPQRSLAGAAIADAASNGIVPTFRAPSGKGVISLRPSRPRPPPCRRRLRRSAPADPVSPAAGGLPLASARWPSPCLRVQRAHDLRRWIRRHYHRPAPGSTLARQGTRLLSVHVG